MQISKSLFFLSGDFFIYFIFHLQTKNKQCLKSTAAFIWIKPTNSSTIKINVTWSKMCSSKTILRLEPILFLEEQRDAPSTHSGFTSHAKHTWRCVWLWRKAVVLLDMYIIRLRIVSNTFFELFSWRLPQICNILARTVIVVEVTNKRFQKNL